MIFIMEMVYNNDNNGLFLIFETELSANQQYDESLTVSPGKKIYFTRKADKLPIAEIRVTSGSGVCFSNNISIFINLFIY